jgi:spermidine/putrescine transport system substrate-binding protein
VRYRKLTFAAGAAIAALALSSCAPSAETPTDPEDQSLVVSIWAAYYPETLAADFEAATGIPVTIVNHANNEEIFAKLLANGGEGIDIAFVSGQYADALNQAGLLEPLDKELIPNEANLYAEAAELAYDPGNTFSMPYAWGTTGLCWRSDLVAEAPTSWNDLLQPAADVTGKTTMLATERWMALPALKSLGYSVNTTDPAELEEARAQLIETKDTLLAFDDTTYYTKLVSGEASMSEAWDGWCNYAIAEDPNVSWMIPEEGSDLWVDTITVLKSSPNKAAAMEFVNYILDVEIGTFVAENILYKVPNQAAMESLDPALLEQFPNMAMSPADLLKQEAIVDVGDFSTEYTRLATEIAAG